MVDDSYLMNWKLIVMGIIIFTLLNILSCIQVIHKVVLFDGIRKMCISDCKYLYTIKVKQLHMYYKNIKEMDG